MVNEGLGKVAQHMRTARERSGRTQADVASRIGPEVDQPRVSKWESGETLPSLSQLFRFAAACGVPPEELIAGIQKPMAHQPRLLPDLDRPAHRVVTNLVSLLEERARLLRRQRLMRGRRGRNG